MDISRAINELELEEYIAVLFSKPNVDWAEIKLKSYTSGKVWHFEIPYFHD